MNIALDRCNDEFGLLFLFYFGIRHYGFDDLKGGLGGVGAHEQLGKIKLFLLEFFADDVKPGDDVIVYDRHGILFFKKRFTAFGGAFLKPSHHGVGKRTVASDGAVGRCFYDRRLLEIFGKGDVFGAVFVKSLEQQKGFIGL